MAASKHILFTSAWYPYKNDPMWGLFVKRHAEAAAIHHQITVLYVHGIYHQSKCLEQELIQENGFTTYYYYFRKANTGIACIDQPLNFIKYLFYNYKGYTNIRKKHGKPDLIHVNILTRAAIIPWLLFILNKTPYIITEHWTRYLPTHLNYKGVFRKLITACIVKKASYVLPVTTNLRDAMQQAGLTNSNYGTVHNVVDTELFKPSALKQDYFIHISCFDDQQKNISGLLRSFAAALKQIPALHLVLVGEGPDLIKMQEFANALPIPKTAITFTGLLENDALSNQLNQSACLVLFSRYENMPVVINESFACGVPVITTDTGGITEHVTPERGIVIESEHEGALTQAFLEMYAHKSRYSASALRNYAEQNFSKTAIAAFLNNLYLDLLTKKS